MVCDVVERQGFLRMLQTSQNMPNDEPTLPPGPPLPPNMPTLPLESLPRIESRLQEQHQRAIMSPRIAPTLPAQSIMEPHFLPIPRGHVSPRLRSDLGPMASPRGTPPRPVFMPMQSVGQPEIQGPIHAAADALLQSDAIAITRSQKLLSGLTPSPSQEPGSHLRQPGSLGDRLNERS